MPTANLEDMQIYYEDVGEGEAVLLAPPSWWPSDTWKIKVVPFLSRRYRRSFLIVAAPAIAANRIMATRSASSLKTAPGFWNI